MYASIQDDQNFALRASGIPLFKIMGLMLFFLILINQLMQDYAMICQCQGMYLALMKATIVEQKFN